MKTWINVFVTLSLLLSSVGFHQPISAFVPASPKSSAGQETAPTATPEATPTPTPTTTIDYGAYPPPITSTPQPTETPIVPSPTPDPGDSGVIPTPIPEEVNEDDPLGLSAIANPAIYIPGKPVYIFWNLTGQNQIMEGSNAQIRVRFPDVSTSESAEGQPDERELILPVTDPQGVIPWEINEQAYFPLYAILDLFIDDISIDTEVIEIGQADFEIGNLDGGTAEGLGGKVRVEVPFDALEESAYFSVRYPSPNKLPSVSLTGNPIEIIAVGKDSGQNITQFRQPIQIQIQYNKNEIFHWSEDDLMVFYYDEKTRDWYPLPTTVDKENQHLIAYSYHLTVFDFKAASWQANSLPTVDSFKVSDFTGAATYNYSFWTPPGVAGLSPNLSLNYNSQVIDEASAYSQASWVGMGWSLETGAITRNMHETNTNEGDDTFSISANGISGLLVPVSVNGSVTTYNTADQFFLKVQFNSTTNVWTAWGKDGIVYTFDQPVKTSKTIGCANTSQLDITWRWSLGAVTDKNGNSITYTYYKEPKSTSCANEIAVYPVTIVYPYNHYRVRFVRESRTDYQNSWTETDARSLYSIQRLKEILVEHDPSGNWLSPTQVRKYVFGYATDTTTTNVIYPRFHWSHGGHTLTLISVQEFSGDGSLSLPATTFYYGDENSDGVDEFMHLTKVDNGLGGQVEMQYARWSYFDDFNDALRSLQTEYGATDQECGPVSGNPGYYYDTQWGAVQGAPYVRCDSSSHRLQVGNDNVDGQPAILSIGHRSIPEHVVKPGSLYRFYVQARAQENEADINWGFIDTTTNTTRMLYSDSTIPSVGTTLVNLEGTLDMPVSFDPSNTKLRLEGDGILVFKLQFMLFPLYYRVTSKTITDSATGQGHTYTYRNDNPSSNTASTSAAVNAAASNCSSLYTCAMREFRGHAVTQITDPSGLTGVTWYYQSDAFKGKPYHTMTVKQDFADDFEQALSQNPNWTVTSGVTGQASIYNVDFDGALKAENTQTNWNVSITHNDYSLSNGDVAVAQFRLNGVTTQGEVGLVSASGKFFGVLIQPNNGKPEALLRYDTGSGLQTGTLLIDRDHFQLDRWYVIKLSVDNDDGFKVRLWQLDDPANHGEGSLSGFTAENWRFRERVNYGTLWLDEYFEGVLYNETETTYAAITQFDTTSGNSIPDVASSTLMTYKDLAVVWAYPTETISINYASDAVLNVGDTKWIGTRTTYQYKAEDQNNSQYGNLTRTITSTWNGSAWVEVRASKTEFWPLDDGSLYLVSLPARILQLDCASGCDFSGAAGLLGETLYLYDSNSVYTSPPTLAGPYNKAGRLRVQRTLIDVVGGQKRYSEIGFGYDEYGNVLTQTTYPGYGTASASPTGDVYITSVVYDSVYHTYPLSQINPLNQTFSTGYDYALGVPTSETDPNGVVATATYDVLGRITAVIRPGDDSTNPTMQFSYNIDGGNHLFWTEAQQRISDATYTKVRKYYNGLGQLLQTQTDADLSETLKTVVNDVYYDAMGRAYMQAVPYSVTLTNGAFTTPSSNPAYYTLTTYDVIGRTYQVIAPDGTIQTSTYTIQAESTVPYNVMSSTNGRGNTTVSWSDALGRAYEVVPPTGPGVTYTYDAADRLTSAQYGPYTTNLTYDIAGRKLAMNDPDMGYWTYQYDALGNLTQQTDARGCVTGLEYDELNRLREKNYSNASGGACGTIAANTSPVSYTYDDGTNGIGRRTGMEDGSGSTLWEYDLRGRQATETVEITGVGIYTTEWTYNSADLLIGMTYPNGEIVSTSHNPQGLVSAVDSESWISYASQAKYDEAGRLLEWTLGNGVKTTNTYNAWDTQGGRLQSTTSITNLTPAATRQHLAYSYDANGNLSTIQDYVATETLNYNYDMLDRLTGVNGAYSQIYGYSATTGNLNSKAGQTLAYADTNHPHAATGMGSNTYIYDANGNMVIRVLSTALGMVTYTLAYDAESRLVGISGGGMSATYTYNGDGERAKVEITTGGDTKATAYIGNYFEVSVGDPIQNQSTTPPNCSTSLCIYLPLVMSSLVSIPAGHAWTSYYYAGGSRVAMRVQSNQEGVEEGVYYLLTDHLGSTAITLNSGANQVAELRYFAWGETRDTNGNTPTQRRYTGQLEAEAGLYFYNARFYDSALGRFVSPDSEVPDKGNPQGFDRYSYVANNPISRIDTSGHCWGVASFIRGIPTYSTTCNNLDMALTIVQSYQASASDRIVAGAYITGEFVAHGIAVVYGAITACGLVSAACYTAITGGTAACADGDCTNEAQIVTQTVQNVPKVIQQGGDQVEQIVTNLSGQWHHVFSNKIMTALGQHPILKSVFNRNDFLVQALDITSHNGYQQWHRLYDVTVVRWLQSNTQATSVQFLNFMKGLYQNADLLKRFPDAWKLIQMGLEELQ